MHIHIYWFEVSWYLIRHFVTSFTNYRSAKKQWLVENTKHLIMCTVRRYKWSLHISYHKALQNFGSLFPISRTKRMDFVKQKKKLLTEKYFKVIPHQCVCFSLSCKSNKNLDSCNKNCSKWMRLLHSLHLMSSDS